MSKLIQCPRCKGKLFFIIAGRPQIVIMRCNRCKATFKAQLRISEKHE